MNKKLLIVLAFFITSQSIIAQMPSSKDTTWKKLYRATPEVTHDLVHTKLECSFDFENAYLNGKVWITAKPHFYQSNKIKLDAKAMDIKEVAIVNGTKKTKLNYEYDAMEMDITLDRVYKNTEKFTLYIDYIAKPDEYNAPGSAAISGAKGLYFINPRGEEPNKATSVWTQGETEGTSVWCPTIDDPAQKTTNEFYITVPQKYVSLSNGLKLSEKKNTNGTRTDYWKMDLPHAPYLFFMGAGEFSIIKDKAYKGKEVSYYVEKDQAKYAMGVFGNTPEMIKFFSEKLGVDYPWQKYSQIVARDYVSGAMENTTAVIHQETAYQDDRELADGNSWEETIAHELFHHWFGDLVTAESWSNLTVNESFANYSEYLWDEYKYGKDYADAHNYSDMQGYMFGPGNTEKHLVRFHYKDEMEMFDGVSYNKGGRILHMLRNYLGDDAFFKSLQNYLNTNKFKAGEAHQLRLAFEEVSGKDLSWFFNQWYFGAGHPKLEISSNYTLSKEEQTVTIAQTQKGDKVFQLPIQIKKENWFG
jgi:aminopeptidase N